MMYLVFLLWEYNTFMLKKSVNPVMKIILDKSYSNLVNKDNIESLSKKFLKNVFKDEEPKWREIYLHNVIDQWIKSNVQNRINYKILCKIIKKSNIKLNQLEEHNIFLIEERVFSIDRHIKTLDVFNKLLDKENVGVKFINATLFLKKETLSTIKKGDLLLTNKRLIIIGDENIAFHWITMSDPTYNNYGFSFIYLKKEYVVRIYDQITLNNTIKNFTGKKVKKWNH